MRTKPTIYIPDSPNNRLIGVLVEEYDNFEILWYHWPKDGDGLKYKLVQEEDYEPVIIFYDNDNICMIYTRRHWGYQDYRIDEGLILPVEILFDGEDHPPYVNDKNKDEKFDKKRKNLINRNYDVEPVKKENIPIKFRTGKGHGANLVPFKPDIVDDPLVKAKKCYAEYKMQKKMN